MNDVPFDDENNLNSENLVRVDLKREHHASAVLKDVDTGDNLEDSPTGIETDDGSSVAQEHCKERDLDSSSNDSELKTISSSDDIVLTRNASSMSHSRRWGYLC